MDTFTLNLTATKDAEGDIDKDAFGEAAGPGLAAICAALEAQGFACEDIVHHATINDETVREGTGVDFVPPEP